MPYFLARLRAPRPTFPGDMTSEEMEIMGRHGAYLAGLAQTGTAVIYGPVLEGPGAWGMAILAVEDEAAARDVTTNDPVILAGRGFSYDILPIVQATLSPAAFRAASADESLSR